LVFIGLNATACKPVIENPDIPQTATLIPGWNIFSSETVEILLPETYQGGEPTEYLPILIEQLKKGDKLQRLSARNMEFLLKEQPELLQFSAFALDDKNNIICTILISKTIATSGLNLNEFIEAVTTSTAAITKVTSQKSIQLENYEAIQVTLEYPDLNNYYSIIYFIQENDAVWMLSYSFSQDLYQSSANEIEQSAKTFNILSTPQK